MPPTKSPTERLNARRGFALPVVLVALVVLSATFLFALAGLKGLRDEARNTRDSVEFERAALTAEARLAYLMATEPFGRESLRIGAARLTGAQTPEDQDIQYATVVKLDERPYLWLENYDQGDRPYIVLLQDEAGLLNLTQADVDVLTRAFQIAGLDFDAAQQLAYEMDDRRQDPLLQSQPIRRPAELYTLPSARELINDSVWRRLNEMVTTYPDNNVNNVNTAPEQVLRSWFDMDEVTAQELIESREETPIITPTDYGLVTPTGTVPNAFTYPSGRVRVTFIDVKSGMTYRTSLIFTPTNRERPIWTENSKVLLQTPPRNELSDLDVFPEIPNYAS